MRRAADLSVPRGGVRLGIHYDPEAFGRFSEAIARYIGTARFLVIQTVIVVVWIGMNAAADKLRFDPYPFILLTLALSLQAAYAAPLILLAQNRQEERDRVALEQDRQQASRTQSDAEFIARELASVRLTLTDVATQEDVERLTRHDDIVSAIDRLEQMIRSAITAQS